MFRPRNTLVTVELRKDRDKQIGEIILPNGTGLYTEAEIVQVGPGCVAAQGGISETADLHPGQIVYVQYRRPTRPGVVEEVGVSVQDGGRNLLIVEQTQIIAIVKDAEFPRLSVGNSTEVTNPDTNPHCDLPLCQEAVEKDQFQLDGHNA